MQANERRYTELLLEVSLRKLKKNKEQVPLADLKTIYRKGYEELLETIRQTAERYLVDFVFWGVEGYYREEDCLLLKEELYQVINSTERKEAICQVLFREPDMMKFHMLAYEMRQEALQIAEKYRKRVKGEQ